MLIKLLFYCLFFVSCTALQQPAVEEANLTLFVPQKPVRVAVVLGGGGARGIAHLGALRELEKAGIRPDLIIGCSAGAVVGAFYADNPELVDTEKLFLKLKKSDLLDMNVFSGRFGFVRGRKLQNFMKKNLRAQTFEDLKIPLVVVATDLFTGESVELAEGSLSSAVNASCAIPGVFKPVHFQSRVLIDGGVSSPLPVEIARRCGAKLVIAIDVSEKLSNSKPSHFLGVAKRSIEIAYKRFMTHSLAQADIAIKMNFQDIGIFCDDLNDHMYTEGRDQAIAMIPEILTKINAFEVITSIPPKNSGL